MPKSPRKNPTPRKLLRLSGRELQQEENADVKDLSEFFQKDSSLSAAVGEAPEPQCAAVDSGHSEFGVSASAASCNVESTAQDNAGGRRRSRKQITAASPEGCTKTTNIRTSASAKYRKGSKDSKRKPQKVSTRSTKAATEKAAKRLATDKQSDVDSRVDLHGASVSDEESAANTAMESGNNVQRIGTGESDDCHQCFGSRKANDPTEMLPTDTCNSVVTMDNVSEEGTHNRTAELPYSDIMMLASAACDSSDATEMAEGHASVAAGQLPGPEDPEGAYMPTPQKNQLRFLSEELLSLNQESAHITTHIHRRSGATPKRGQAHGSGGKRSLSTPRKFNVLNSNSKSNSRSPRSTPRKVNNGQKTPWKVKFPFSTTPAKSEKETVKTLGSKKKSPCGSSVLKFPTPSKKQTKRKLYAESPEHGSRKPAKASRSV